MTKRFQIYKCGVCGNTVNVIDANIGTLSCCSQDMTLLRENTFDASLEKHVPVITQTDVGYKVSVGSIEHPMIDTHYILYVELTADGKVYRRFFQPEEKPVEEFVVGKAESVSARAYCNLHGLWKSN